MSFINPDVAGVDRLGYVYCVEHAEGRELEWMDSGNSAVQGCSCEVCGFADFFDVSLKVQVPAGWTEQVIHAPMSRMTH